MSFIRTLRYHHFHALLKLNNPSQRPTNPIHRYSSLSAQFQHKIDTESIDSKDVVAKNKKPLNLLFKEAVGLSEKLEHSESESEGEGKGESGNEGLKKKLRKLEIEVRRLREDKRRILKEDNGERENLKKEIKRDEGVSKVDSKHRRLYALFSEKNVDARDKNLGKEYYKRVEEPIVYKELSSDMAFFANHLYKQGYFKDANFLPRNKFEATCFENNYGRDFLKFAAEKFGKDNQEIAKWLSGNDLKKVALFGCPSLSRKNIFSAKTLRTFFKIQEDTVCSKCVLKQSCKFVNQSIWKGNTKTLDLAVVMRVITLYALEAVPPELAVPDEVKASVSRLLKEILHLSETVS